MGDLAVYSFARVSCLMNGIPITDYWEGDDVIKVTRNDDAVNVTVGADGNAVASVSLDLSAVVEFKLKPSSISNTVLEALELNFRSGLRVQPVPFILTDYQTSQALVSAKAVILSRPTEITFGKLATPRTWRIFVGGLVGATIGQI